MNSVNERVNLIQARLLLREAETLVRHLERRDQKQAKQYKRSMLSRMKEIKV